MRIYKGWPFSLSVATLPGRHTSFSISFGLTMAPTTQKALGIAAEGEYWKVFERWPVPTPGPNDILVKVMSAALNPADWKIQTYGLSAMGGEYPYIGGLDGAGVVEEVGSQVKKFTKGDKV